MVGNLMPDLVRGRLPENLAPDVLHGIETHRRVDRLTDTHSGFQKTVARLRPTHGRFAPILADIIYDHLLWRQWKNLFKGTPRGFIESAHNHLIHGRSLMPSPMQTDVDRMIRGRLLFAYATPAGLEAALQSLAKHLSIRFKRQVELSSAVAVMEQQVEAMAADFEWVFTDLRSTILSL